MAHATSGDFQLPTLHFGKLLSNRGNKKIKMHSKQPLDRHHSLSDSSIGSSSRLSESSVNIQLPQNKTEADLFDEAFSKELALLPLEEHEKILFDIHGISRTEEEDDPAFIRDRLHEFEVELNAIEDKPAFYAAERVNPVYVNDQAFRSMFLRCTWYQAREAAELMVLHFEKKRELFREDEIMGRDIRLSDLSPDERKMLEEGILQVLPARDASGRTILWAGADKKERQAVAMGRVFWYYIMATHKSEEMQRNGTVLVVYHYEQHLQSVDYHEAMARIYNGIPLKLTGAHYCSNREAQYPFAAGVRLSLHREQQFRFRSHYGARDEVDFALQTFGIPTQQFPMKRDGSSNLRWHRKWLQAQQEREEREVQGVADSAEAILVPRRSDVLFGRGKHTREHAGNLRLVNLCDSHTEAYNAASRPQKTEISNNLVSVVKESDGRFLKWKDDGWVEVDDVDAREKVSHFFRHLRAKAGPSVGGSTRKRTLDSS